MAVTVSEQVFLHGGPDTGTPYPMTPVLVHASTSIPNRDAVGARILSTLNNQITMVTRGTQTYSAATAPSANAAFGNGATVVTGAAGIVDRFWLDADVVYGASMGTGTAPSRGGGASPEGNRRRSTWYSTASRFRQASRAPW